MKENREPSLFRKLITIYHEQAMRRKALRILAKQTWSFDFLSAMLIRAGKSLGSGIQLEIKNIDGQVITLKYDKAAGSAADTRYEADILNNLDNNAVVEEFIKQHSRI